VRHVGVDEGEHEGVRHVDVRHVGVDEGEHEGGIRVCEARGNMMGVRHVCCERGCECGRVSARAAHLVP
jgi:hypothetical protein